MIKVSVIIPVYKVEKFVRKCAESLLTQTLSDVEYIFVDDCSPDSSVAIIEDVMQSFRERNARIIHHKENLGLPSARNTGLLEANGEYVFHCDGDDWVEPEMLEKMYNQAKLADCDIVYCDFFLSFEKNERRMVVPSYSNIDDFLRRGLLGGSVKYNVWNKLVKRSLYMENGIKFPDGHPMGEDMTMIRVASMAKSVSYIPEAFYHYVKINANAYSQTQSEKQLNDIRFNVDVTVDHLEKLFGSSIERDIAFFKLGIKLPFLISDQDSQYELWSKWYPEANKYAMENDALPVRTRLLQLCADNHLWFLVRLYYWVVYKFVYGILYK